MAEGKEVEGWRKWWLQAVQLPARLVMPTLFTALTLLLLALFRPQWLMVQGAAWLSGPCWVITVACAYILSFRVIFRGVETWNIRRFMRRLADDEKAVLRQYVESGNCVVQFPIDHGGALALVRTGILFNPFPTMGTKFGFQIRRDALTYLQRHPELIGAKPQTK